MRTWVKWIVGFMLVITAACICDVIYTQGRIEGMAEARAILTP